jgi:hypothetical protein
MSSPFEHFKAGCSGKVQFISFTKAEKTAKRMRKGNRDCHVEAYHCQHCQKFHVGENRAYHPKTKQKGMPRGVIEE